MTDRTNVYPVGDSAPQWLNIKVIAGSTMRGIHSFVLLLLRVIFPNRGRAYLYGSINYCKGGKIDHHYYSIS
jgi:hypothetical protein